MVHDKLYGLLCTLADTRTGADEILSYPGSEHLPAEVLEEIRRLIPQVGVRPIQVSNMTRQLLERHGESELSRERLIVGALYEMVVQAGAEFLDETDLYPDRWSRLISKFPQIRGWVDKDGLLDGAAGVTFHSDHVDYGLTAFSYHPDVEAVRLPELVETLLDIRQRWPSAKWGIRLDHRAIHRGKPASYLGKARWYGAPFDIQRLSRLLSPGCAQPVVHYRPPDSVGVLPLDRIEAYWFSSAEGFLEFQLESLPPLGAEQAGRHYIRTPYLHSMWSKREERFTHTDGAIKLYSPEAYADRFSARLPKIKKTHKVKIWRTDAPLEADIWGTLVSQFFHHNELVQEYLSGE